MEPHHGQSVSQSGETRSNGVLMKTASHPVVLKLPRLKADTLLSVFYTVEYCPFKVNKSKARSNFKTKAADNTFCSFYFKRAYSRGEGALLLCTAVTEL